MYKDYNMTQLTLPMETSVLIPINDIVETITKTEFDENSDIIVAQHHTIPK